MYGCSKYFRKKGIVYVNNNIFLYLLLLLIDQNDIQREELIFLYMEFVIVIGSLMLVFVVMNIK